MVRNYLGNNGSPGTWRYDGRELATIISAPSFDANAPVKIHIQTSSVLVGVDTLLHGVRGRLARLQRVMPLISNTWPKEWSPDELLRAAQTGNRIGLSPARAYAELEALEKEYGKAREAIRQLGIDSTLIGRIEAHLTTGVL